MRFSEESHPTSPTSPTTNSNPYSYPELNNSLQNPANTRLEFAAVLEHPTGQTWRSSCPHKKMQRADCQCSTAGFPAMLLEAPSYFDRWTADQQHYKWHSVLRGEIVRREWPTRSVLHITGLRSAISGSCRPEFAGNVSRSRSRPKEMRYLQCCKT